MTHFKLAHNLLLFYKSNLDIVGTFSQNLGAQKLLWGIKDIKFNEIELSSFMSLIKQNTPISVNIEIDTERQN